MVKTKVEKNILVATISILFSRPTALERKREREREIDSVI